MESKVSFDKINSDIEMYIKSFPAKRFRKDKQLEKIQVGMENLSKNVKLEIDKIRYNDLIDKLNNYYESNAFKQKYKGRDINRPNLPKLPVVDAMSLMSSTPTSVMNVPEDEPMKTDSKESVDSKESMEEEPIPEEPKVEEPIPEEPKVEEPISEEPKVEEQKVEMDEEIKEKISDESINKPIKVDEGLIKTGMEGNFELDIPKSRLIIKGKSIEELNKDIKYFLNKYPSLLKTETRIYNESDKKNMKVIVEIHKRIQGVLSPEGEKKEKTIGIILDADKYIDQKINELLARKTLEGLTPANLVNITEIPKSKGMDVGSYTILKNSSGVPNVENAPVYRAIPSTNEEQMDKDKMTSGEINQNTIYKNIAKRPVDIAKMQIQNNPFVKSKKTNRLNIIL